MAITNICGFETGAGGVDNECTLTGAGASIQTTTKRTGDYAFKSLPVTTATAFALIAVSHAANGTVNVSTGLATTYCRFYLNIAALPSASERIFQIVNSAATTKFSIQLGSDGKLSAFDTVVSALGTGATVLGTGTWYRIEVSVATGASAAWEVKINGTTELSGSTANLTATNGVSVRLGKSVNSNGSGYECYFDDVAISDSAFPGAGAVQCLRPSGNGNYTAWTGTFTDVDDLTSQAGNDIDTTFVSSSTNTQAETVALEDCSARGITGVINAVKSITIVRDVSNTTNIQHRTRVTSPGTADTDLSVFDSAGTYAILASVMPTNPSGGAAWLAAGVNSLEVGIVHSQANSREARCTMMCAMVDFVPTEIFNPLFQTNPRTVRI